MDADLVIGIAHTLTIAGAVVVLAGLVTMARPIATIGLGVAREPAWQCSSDFALAAAG
jgi:hypothetical protein